MRRITSGRATRRAKHEDFDMLTVRTPRRNFITGEKVEAANLILGAPSPLFLGAFFKRSVI